MVEAMLLHGHPVEIVEQLATIKHPLADVFVTFARWTQDQYSEKEIEELTKRTWLLCCQPKCVLKVYATRLLQEISDIRDPFTKNVIL